MVLYIYLYTVGKTSAAVSKWLERFTTNGMFLPTAWKFGPGNFFSINCNTNSYACITFVKEGNISATYQLYTCRCRCHAGWSSWNWRIGSVCLAPRRGNFQAIVGAYIASQNTSCRWKKIVPYSILYGNVGLLLAECVMIIRCFWNKRHPVIDRTLILGND